MPFRSRDNRGQTPIIDSNYCVRLALSRGLPLGSERFGEIMCAAVGVRRARRRPGRPIVKHDQSDRVEDQTDFGF